MDVEWALDEDDKQLYIVQARAGTVQSRRDVNHIEEYKLREEGKILVKGTSVGNKMRRRQSQQDHERQRHRRLQRRRCALSLR